MKKSLFIFAALFAFYFGYQAYTGGFSTESITYEWERANEWKVPSLEDTELSNVKTILSQKFRYMSRGNQAYVFESEDGKYVLKFFRFAHLKPKWWLEALPDLPPIVEYRKSKRESQVKRLERLFQGHSLAYTEDCANCGLLYVHLQKTGSLNHHVSVIDRLGIQRSINLDNTLFVLQKRAKPARDELTFLLKEGHMNEVYARIDQIFNLYLSEYDKGIVDRDYNVIDNVAFAEERAIRIDVGKLRHDVSIQNQELRVKDLKIKVVDRLLSWTKKYFPQRFAEVDAYLKTSLQNIQ